MILASILSPISARKNPSSAAVGSESPACVSMPSSQQESQNFAKTLVRKKRVVRPGEESLSASLVSTGRPEQELFARPPPPPGAFAPPPAWTWAVHPEPRHCNLAGCWPKVVNSICEVSPVFGCIGNFKKADICRHFIKPREFSPNFS